MVQRLDPRQALGDGDRLPVDGLRLADDAGYRTEPCGDPQRTGVGEIGQTALEHARVELVGLAIDVEIGAREARPQEGRSERHAAQEQFVDEGVLRAAQRQRVEARKLEEAARILGPGMRGIEYQGRRKRLGLDRLKGRTQAAVLCPDFIPHRALTLPLQNRANGESTADLQTQASRRKATMPQNPALVNGACGAVEFAVAFMRYLL